MYRPISLYASTWYWACVINRLLIVHDSKFRAITLQIAMDETKSSFIFQHLDWFLS